MTENTTTRDIVKAVSAEAIQKALGVSDRTVRHAASEGRFTASWYLPIREMCKGKGIDCPEHLFNWHPVNTGSE